MLRYLVCVLRGHGTQPGPAPAAVQWGPGRHPHLPKGLPQPDPVRGLQTKVQLSFDMDMGWGWKEDISQEKTHFKRAFLAGLLCEMTYCLVKVHILASSAFLRNVSDL